MAFRLLHTADWQLGMKATAAGAAAPAVRAARLAAARRVVALANQHAVDVLLLAGDTFEDTTVPPVLVQQTVDLLRESRAPVFVLPANHDPLVPGGLFDHPAWRDAAPRVTVLRESGPIAVGAADLFACPLVAAHSVADPLARLPTAPPPSTGPRARFRIGVAHGSVVGAAAPADAIRDDHPLDLRHAERAGLDWLALGHWHAPSSYSIGGAIRAAYCGAHEPTRFGECNADGASGQCLLVTLAAPGAPPQVKALPTAELEWRDLAVELRHEADLGALRARLDAEPPESRQRVLLRLSLSGVVGTATRVAVSALAELARGRFLHARVDAERLLARPDDDGWIALLPPGAAPAAARALLARATASGDPSAAAIARRALDLLFEFHVAAGGGADAVASPAGSAAAGAGR